MRTMRLLTIVPALLLFLGIGVSYAQTGGAPILAREPAVSDKWIVFSYAGDLWRLPRAGGEAVQLTNGAGLETSPVFSPDGNTVAFAGSYDGNQDLFTVPVVGGVPKRLTWHPYPEAPLAFTADGKRILFRSTQDSPMFYPRLYTMPVEGGFPVELPLPSGNDAAYSPDGARVAYMPIAPAFGVWKRYRGGRTTPIWIANLADSKVEAIPRENSNDHQPAWVGDTVYFLSDREGAMTLFGYDTKSKKVERLIANSGLDYKSMSAGPGAIVLEQFGALQLFDLKTKKTTPVKMTLTGDMRSVRPYYDKVASRVETFELSPTGARAVFSARGEILTVPAEKGDVRNLTNSSGVADRDPAWSPDGKSVAWFSDESGEYRLHVAAQNGMGEIQKYDLGKPAFYYEPRWSPDSKKIVFRDSNLTVMWIDLASKKVTSVDADTYDTPFREELNPSWSPDSKWIVYTKNLKNHLRAVFVYSLDSGKSTQLSDGMSDARHAAFDKDGRHLYFTASTNLGLSTGWLDMSSIDRVSNRSVYVVVLRKEDVSPLAPESDEEKGEPAKKEEPKKDENKDVRIDFEGISQRVLSLPIPARSYGRLMAGKSGTLFLLEDPPVGASGQPVFTLHKFELKTRKTDKVMDGVHGIVLSANGDKMMFRQGPRWAIAATSAPPKPGEGTLKMDAMEVRVDPPAEWKQIYREVWRIERDFFYDPGFHGLEIGGAEKRYSQYLSAVAHRDDLNYLLAEMLGQFSVGHMNVGGGAYPDVPQVPVGLLGADYKVENGRYRFARVYNGENWNPELRAPLTQPGVNVTAGEYLLAVNGKNVTSQEDLFSYFEATAGKSVTLRVGTNPNGDGARDVIVVPLRNEQNLRYLAWIEDNRRKVEKLSGGRIGYLHLPNTSNQGYTNFNRYFFAQVGKDGVVLDERYNGGGYIADYIIDYLRRPLTNYFSTRAGQDFTTPMNAIFGPKAMIVNEYAGSGGDAMPWLFKKFAIGPLVGKRTWGGLVGIFGFPALIDGGRVTAPNLAFYNLNQDWDVENKGVAPDVEVEFDPALWRQGRDPQLEKAVELVSEALKKTPPPVYKKPAYPNYHKGTGFGAGPTSN